VLKSGVASSALALNPQAMTKTAPKPRPSLETAESNVLKTQDSAVHGWYRFVLSYPPHLVRKYAEIFDLNESSLLCDPFCGTGTTLVEGKKLGIPSVGCDAHPFAALVSGVKTNWQIDPSLLRKLGKKIAIQAEDKMESVGLPPHSFTARLMEEALHSPWKSYRLSVDEEAVMPTGFVSDRPLARLIILRECLEKNCASQPEEVRNVFRVCLAHVIANGAGNFAFGPEIYRTKEKHDYDVAGHFAKHVTLMADDLAKMHLEHPHAPEASVFLNDARSLDDLPGEISAVITSPPYPNEKDYTRTTRVESLLLGFTSDRAQLRSMKETLLRSNTRNVFVADRDSEEVRDFASIQAVCKAIEDRRIELCKTSGFERLYHKVVAHYFGGMRRHLRVLKPKLKRRAKLAYVVGDQLSFLMVPVATATLLGEVAEAEGYRVLGIDLWRERVGTKVRNAINGDKTVRVREEVLILEKK
jgi:hypothetical protein